MRMMVMRRKHRWVKRAITGKKKKGCYQLLQSKWTFWSHWMKKKGTKGREGTVEVGKEGEGFILKERKIVSCF